jgi:hypothetical protein
MQTATAWLIWILGVSVNQDACFVTALRHSRYFEPPTPLTGRIFVSKSDLDVRNGLLKQREAHLESTGESLSIMCVGESGTGKSTLIANIFTAPITRSSESRSPECVGGPTLAIVESHLSLDCEGIPLKIKIIDTPGKSVSLPAPNHPWLFENGAPTSSCHLTQTFTPAPMNQ